MKKLNALLLLVFVGSFTCLGCGGGGNVSEAEAEAAATEAEDPAGLMGGEDMATDTEGGSAP